MKRHKIVNAEREAARSLELFLANLPNVEIEEILRDDPSNSDKGIDIRVEGRFADRPLHLAVDVKSSGQPRIVRDAARQLRTYLRDAHSDAIPIVMAPYLSPQARDVCKDERVGYLDFMGNALIAFDSVYIEREVPGRPETERRVLRSLYQPKSARILRRLLAEPGRNWRTVELAEAAQVSVGLVSNVGSVLRERGWADQTDAGLLLSAPGDLLDSWAENYRPPQGEEFRRHTTLHGSRLAERLRGLDALDGKVALASFSAAEWLSPFARHPNHYFYADEAGLAALDQLLATTEAPKGANVIIVVPEEEGVLDDAIPVGEGRIATSPVQTYLDLMQGGDRGQEAAAHLRQKLLHRAS